MAARYEGDAFRERFGPWAVVAGGSDGIGAAFARSLAKRGLNVALVARREAPLEALARALAEETGVLTRTIAADLTADDPIAPIAAATADLDVGLLVYNAGSNPSAGRFLDQEVDAARFLVALSCRGPVELAHHFGRRLRKRGRGGLVLMSSLGSLAGNGFHATYAATKAFDTILAEGLWVELVPSGVDVLGVLAGATRTETMLTQNSSGFADAMDPADVAEGALDHLGKGPSWIPGEENRAAARGMWPVPRVPLVNGMTQAGAALLGFEAPMVEGIEFHEE